MLSTHYRFIAEGRILIFLSIILSYVGCTNDQTPQSIPEHIQELENVRIFDTDFETLPEVTLTEAAIYGDSHEVLMSGRILATGVDNSGRVYIAEPNQNIHVFNSDGSYKTEFGIEGQGPGEFERIRAIKTRNNKIHVLDEWQQKISVFKLNNENAELISEYNISLTELVDQPDWLSRTQEKGLMYRPTSLYITPNEEYKIGYSDRIIRSDENVEGRTTEITLYNPDQRKFTYNQVLSFNWTGRVVIEEVDERTIVVPQVPYKRDTKMDFRDGRWLAGWNDEFLIRFYNEMGSYTKAIYYSDPNQKLTQSDVERYYNDAHNMIRNAVLEDEHPETWPAYQNLFWDDQQRVWISRLDDDPTTTELIVVDSDGEPQARLELPAKSDIQKIANGNVYVTEKKEEEFSYVVRYKFSQI